MKKLIKSYSLVLLFLVGLAAFLFRCGWGSDRIFSGSDCNIGLVAYGHNLFPSLFRGVYTSVPVFGAVASAPFSLFNLGRWFLSPSLFCDTWYSVYLVFSSLFLISYLRLWKLRWTSCLFGAVAAFWLGSVTLSSAGHLTKLGVMMFFTLATFLVEKAVRAETHRDRTAYAVGAGVSVGFMLLEQQDVALLAGLFLGPYTLFRLFQTAPKKPLVWAELLVPIALIGLLMAAPTAMDAYQQNVTEVGLQDNPKAQWEYVTQWSMVPAELPDLIAPGYTGWKTGDPSGPYWGRAGQSAEWEATGQGFQNFRLDSLYMGAIPVGLALFGLFAAFLGRKEDRKTSTVVFCWAIFALLALVLSFGKFSPVFKLFYQLPLVGNIRAPIKLLHNFQVFNAILAAYGLDQLMRREWNWKRILIVLAVFVGLFGLLAMNGDTARFSAWGQYANVIADTVQRAWLHAAMMILLLAAFVVCRWKKPRPVWTVAAASLLVGALVVNGAMLISHYFVSEDVSQLKKGNVVLNYLKENQGNERIYFLDQEGIYDRWLAVEGRYYDLNFFNIWQMPRMPAEYTVFLSAASKNAIRLWQLSSVKYVTAPAGVLTQLDATLKEQLRPKLYYRFVREGNGIGVQSLMEPAHNQDQVLLEFNASIPRFALFNQWEVIPLDEQCPMLFAEEFNPLQKVLIEPGQVRENATGTNGFTAVEASVHDSDAVVETHSDKPGVLLFTQRYEPEWKVTIDGKPAELLRCNDPAWAFPFLPGIMWFGFTAIRRE